MRILAGPTTQLAKILHHTDCLGSLQPHHHHEGVPPAQQEQQRQKAQAVVQQALLQQQQEMQHRRELQQQQEIQELQKRKLEELLIQRIGGEAITQNHGSTNEQKQGTSD